MPTAIKTYKQSGKTLRKLIEEQAKATGKKPEDLLVAVKLDDNGNIDDTQAEPIKIQPAPGNFGYGVARTLASAPSVIPATIAGLGVGGATTALAASNPATIAAAPYAGMTAGLATGGAVGAGADYLVNKALQKLWPSAAEYLDIGAQVYPKTTVAANVLSSIAGQKQAGLKALASVIKNPRNLGPVLRAGATPLLTSAGVGAGQEAAMEKLSGQDLDPGRIATAGLLSPLVGGGEARFGNSIVNRVSGIPLTRMEGKLRDAEWNSKYAPPKGTTHQDAYVKYAEKLANATPDEVPHILDNANKLYGIAKDPERILSMAKIIEKQNTTRDQRIEETKPLKRVDEDFSKWVSKNYKDSQSGKAYTRTDLDVMEASNPDLFKKFQDEWLVAKANQGVGTNPVTGKANENPPDLQEGAVKSENPEGLGVGKVISEAKTNPETGKVETTVTPNKTEVTSTENPSVIPPVVNSPEVAPTTTKIPISETLKTALLHQDEMVAGKRNRISNEILTHLNDLPNRLDLTPNEQLQFLRDMEILRKRAEQNTGVSADDLESLGRTALQRALKLADNLTDAKAQYKAGLEHDAKAIKAIGSMEVKPGSESAMDSVIASEKGGKPKATTSADILENTAIKPDTTIDAAEAASRIRNATLIREDNLKGKVGEGTAIVPTKEPETATTATPKVPATHPKFAEAYMKDGTTKLGEGPITKITRPTKANPKGTYHVKIGESTYILPPERVKPIVKQPAVTTTPVSETSSSTSKYNIGDLVTASKTDFRPAVKGKVEGITGDELIVNIGKGANDKPIYLRVKGNEITGHIPETKTTTKGSELTSDPFMIRAFTTAAKVINRDIYTPLMKAAGKATLWLTNSELMLPGATESLMKTRPVEGGVLMDEVQPEYRRIMRKLQNHFNEPIEKAVSKLKPSKREIEKVTQYLDEMRDFDGQSGIDLSPREQELANAVRESFLRSAEAQREDGPLVEGEREKDPNLNYAATAIMDKNVRKILTSGTAEQQKPLVDAYILWHKQHDPKSTPEKAKDDLNLILGKSQFQAKPNPTFAPLIKAEGVGLPPIMREKSILNRLVYFNMRSAAGLSWYRNVQKIPAIAKMFGITDDGHGGKYKTEVAITDPDYNKYTIKGYSDIPQVPDNLSGDPNFEAIRSELLMPMKMTDDKLEQVSAFVNSMRLGPKSAFRDIVSSIGPVAAWIKPSELKYVSKAIADVFSGKSTAVSSGAISSKNVGEFYLQNGVRNVMGRITDVMRKYQGRDLAERGVREVLVELGKGMTEARIAANDTAFLEQFAGKNWRDLKYKDLLERASTRFMEQVQGSYSPEYLNRRFTRGSAPGFFKATFTLSRWAFERARRYRMDVLKPLAEKGDIKPFLKSSLAYLGIAAPAIEAIEYLLTDQKPREMTWGEYFNLVNDDGTPSEKKMDELAYDVAAKSALVGLGGILSYAVYGALQTKNGEAMLPVENPGWNFITSNTARLMDAIDAYDGENLAKIIAQIPGETLGNEIQGIRLMRNALSDKEETGAREERIWKRVTGQSGYNTRGSFGAGANPFTARADLVKEQDPNEILKMGPAMARYYKTSASKGASTFKNPIREDDYYRFLSSIQGDNAMNKQYQLDLKQAELNKYRKAVAKEGYMRMLQETAP